MNVIAAAELIRDGANAGACDYRVAIAELMAYHEACGRIVQEVPESDVEAREWRDTRGYPDRVRSDLSTIGCTVGREIRKLIEWQRNGWRAPKRGRPHYQRAFRAGMDPENAFRCQAEAEGREIPD